MNGINLFNAIAHADDELLDHAAAAGAGKDQRKSGKMKYFAVAAAAFLLFAGVVAAVVALKKENKPADLFESGFFSLKVYADEVYIDGVDVDNHAKKDEARYIFEKPAQDDFKYLGLWLSSQSSCAIEFREDGSFFMYLLKDPRTYRFVYSGYFSISGDDLTLYLPKEESAAVCKLRYFSSYIRIKPQNDVEMTFKKTNVQLAYDPPEDKTSTDASSFRNIPWTLDEEQLEIVFGGNRSLAFWHKDTLTREDLKYEWNAQTDTVSFSDWKKREGVVWTGRIEDGSLVISNGKTVLTLYDPAAAEAQRKASFPFDKILFISGDERDYCIKFRSDRTYTVGRYDENTKDISMLYGSCSGDYEFDESGPLKDYSGKVMIFFPSGMSFKILPEESALYRFMSLCDQNGQKLIYDKEGDLFRLSGSDGQILLVLYEGDEA